MNCVDNLNACLVQSKDLPRAPCPWHLLTWMHCDVSSRRKVARCMKCVWRSACLSGVKKCICTESLLPGLHRGQYKYDSHIDFRLAFWPAPLMPVVGQEAEAELEFKDLEIQCCYPGQASLHIAKNLVQMAQSQLIAFFCCFMISSGIPILQAASARCHATLLHERQDLWIQHMPFLSQLAWTAATIRQLCCRSWGMN